MRHGWICGLVGVDRHLLLCRIGGLTWGGAVMVVFKTGSSSRSCKHTSLYFRLEKAGGKFLEYGRNEWVEADTYDPCCPCEDSRGCRLSLSISCDNVDLKKTKQWAQSAKKEERKRR